MLVATVNIHARMYNMYMHVTSNITSYSIYGTKCNEHVHVGIMEIATPSKTKEHEKTVRER